MGFQLVPVLLLEAGFLLKGFVVPELVIVVRADLLCEEFMRVILVSLLC